MIGVSAVLVACQGALCADGARAQDAQDAEFRLKEVVVTAEKRAERAQDVPIAIAVFDPQSLQAMHAVTTQDLQFAVPALTYNYQNGFGQPYMRGVGSELTEPNADASVATYVDGAYISYSQSTIMNLMGIERVEVLEGPQGTLFGRNAVGGAINIITLSPSQQPEGQATVTVGDYGDKEVSGHLSGPVTDTLRVGLYTATTYTDPYVIYLAPDGDVPPGQPPHDRSWGARVKAIWQPLDWMIFTGSVEETESLSFLQNTLRQVDPSLYPPGQPVASPYTVTADSPDYLHSVERSATLREEFDFSWAHLVGISNYRNTHVFSTDDADATQAFILNAYINVPERQYSQEVQLLSPASSAIKWLAGIYYFNDVSSFSPDGIVTPLFSYQAFGSVDTQSRAAFGQVTFPFDPWIKHLSLTLGGRYTRDTKQVGLYTNFFGSSGAETASTVYPDNGDSHTWDKFTPKVTLDYKLTDTLLYATYSEGFKSGVYNILSPASPGPVAPEVLKAVQVGSKSELGRRLRLNVEAYYYRWSDLQVEVINFTAGGGSLGGLENAASAKMYGVDIDSEAIVTENFRLRMSLSLEHSEYTKFPDLSGFESIPGTVGLTAISVDATGNETERTPKWVGNIGADYVHDLPVGGNLAGHVNLYYNDGYFWTAQDTFRQHPYALLGASIDYTLPDDRWKVTAWGTNLTNRYYAWEFTANGGLGALVQDAPPRMYGVTVNFTF